MSVNYLPINGNAGTVSISLIDRESGEILDSITSLDIIDFEEEDEESEFNEIITNINDELIKNHTGHRKRINFSVLNSEKMDSNNLAKIFQLIQMLNLANYNQQIYKLSIQFRGSNVSGIMQDAIYIGSLKLNELSKRANIAQSIAFEFKNKTAGILDYSIDAFFQYFLLEDDSGKVLLESGNDIILEAYDIT